MSELWPTSKVASAVATRPEQRLRQLRNEAFNEADMLLRSARRDLTGGGCTPYVSSMFLPYAQGVLERLTNRLRSLGEE